MSILGENHPDTLESMNNLALLYDNQGQYDKACPLYIQCLKKRKSTLSENHPHIISSMHNLAVLYDKQGKYIQALPLYKKCLERFKNPHLSRIIRAH
jgi:tetratricopeptide (TPR) repeat protein